MKAKPFELKPTLGIKIVLTALCVCVGLITAFYLFR
jgi:hypothetical protein